MGVLTTRAAHSLDSRSWQQDGRRQEQCSGACALSRSPKTTHSTETASTEARQSRCEPVYWRDEQCIRLLGFARIQCTGLCDARAAITSMHGCTETSRDEKEQHQLPPVALLSADCWAA